VKYQVRFTDRAARDLESIYEYIAAGDSGYAHAWFKELVAGIYSLERFTERGAAVPERRGLRQLFFGTSANLYRIIYATEKRKRVVNVLHIRHGARSKGTAQKLGQHKTKEEKVKTPSDKHTGRNRQADVIPMFGTIEYDPQHMTTSASARGGCSKA
jgi:plasmid stabilization system protein ParE